jgi:hypothetical protein
MAAKMAFVKAQVCGACKEELLTAGKNVLESCDLCFDERVSCRVGNHKSVPLGKDSLHMTLIKFLFIVLNIEFLCILGFVFSMHITLNI